MKRTLVSVAIFFSMAACLFPQPARADAWGANYYAAYMKEMMEKIQFSIYGSLLASLKMAAVQMLNQQVGQLMGGGAGGQAQFITNYSDFLYQGPKQRADLYMNDFFTMTTRGRGSAANYSAAGSIGSIGGGYTQYLESVGRQATVDAGAPCTIDLEESAHSETWAEEGDFRGLNAFVSNPCNNPYGYALEAEGAYQGELMRQQQAAAVEATSSGVLGAKDGDNVIAPAASIEAMMVKIQNLPADIIANSTNPTELMGGVVSAMANQVVNNLVRNGVGMVQSNIQRQMGQVNTQVNSALGGATTRYGAGAQFRTDVIQQSIRVNPSTPVLTNTTTGGI